MILNKIFKFRNTNSLLSLKNQYMFGTGSKFQVSNPITGKISFEYPNTDTDADMKKQISLIQSTRAKWNQLSIQAKKSYISQFITEFELKKQFMVKLMHDSTGRNIKECEIQFINALQMIKYDNQQEYKTVTVKDCGKYYLQPYQNILVVYDHRNPMLSALKYLVVGMIAGNGIILNPKRYALPIAKQIETIWRNTIKDYPLIYCPLNMFTDGLEYIVQNHDTAFVSYSGKIEEGNRFYHFMAIHSEIFAQSQFLLESNDAAYVTKNLSQQSLNKAVNQIVKGCFFSGGDCFNAIKRIFVDQQIKQKFIVKFLQAAKLYKIDRQNSLMSPIITSTHIKQALQRLKQLQNYKKPQLKLLSEIKYEKAQKFLNMSPLIYQIQGIPDIQYWTKIYPMPACFIESVSSSGLCIDKINQSIFGITATIFTDNLNEAEEIGKQLEVGSVCINRWGFSHGIPYAARKRSGKGWSFSKFSYNNLVRSKSVSGVI